MSTRTSSASDYIKRRTAATSYATARLFSKERFYGGVYEPFRIDEGIIKAAHTNGYSIFMTSIGLLNYDRHDIDNIIGEPSFHPKVGPTITALLEKSLDLALHKVAFLMPLESIADPEMIDLATRTPLARIYIMESRLKYRKGVMAWYLWERGWLESPALRWI